MRSRFRIFLVMVLAVLAPIAVNGPAMANSIEGATSLALSR